MKKLFAILMIVMIVMCFMPMAAFADEEAVAMIKGEPDATFTSLDNAVKAAKDGETIYLLKDCTTAGISLDKNLIINGSAGAGEESNKTITFNDKGIALWGTSLTFENCKVEMKGIGSTPYTAEWNWMAICASKDASLTLNNTEMTMDGTDEGNAHAIYFCLNNKLNLNNSTLTIRNYPQDALEWNGGDGGYNVNILNSTFISDHNRSGFTGTFYATIDNSKVDVINSIGNGSNGSHFDIKNGSEVNFNNNGAHGLSARKLTIDNSTVNAIGNGANGIYIGAEGIIEKGSRVTVNNNECKIGSKWTKPGAIYVGKSLDVSDEDVKLEIIGNKNCGVYVKRGARANIKTGVIKTNINEVELVHDATGTEVQNARTGGGIFNDGGTVVLGEKVELYNNHAAIAGDDIYNAEGATITFGATGANWKLDGEPDCTDDITGWFDDSENNRWNAHGEEPLHMEEFIPTENGVEGEKALKAAHGKIVIPPYIPPVTHYYTVIYNDGVEGEVVFPDQINSGLSYYTLTPEFNGTPSREGYEFKGWTPAVAERVTADAYYKAVWEKIEEPVQPTEPEQPENPDKPNKPLPGDKELVNDTTNTGTDVPKTGDTVVNTLVLNLMLLSISAMAGAVLCVRRKITKK